MNIVKIAAIIVTIVMATAAALTKGVNMEIVVLIFMILVFTVGAYSILPLLGTLCVAATCFMLACYLADIVKLLVEFLRPEEAE